MSLKKSIFDSYHEKKLFKHLNSVWEGTFNIYPQLSFTKIFDIETLKVSCREKNFLLKTNIDYTICDKNDRPLMCIEFDGLCHGYSRDGKYIQIKEEPFKNQGLSRKEKMELKLRIAKEHNFPFYIVSYSETKYITERIHLAVIDSIIGQAIANMQLPRKVSEYIERDKDILDRLNEYAYHEYIQDLVLDAEVELELDWDPISRKKAEIMGILFSKRIMKRYSFRYFSEPELPEDDPFDIEGLKKRVEAWKTIEWHCCEVTCETIKGLVTEKAKVRNFEGGFASPIIIAKNIAELIAFFRVAIQNGIYNF